MARGGRSTFPVQILTRRYAGRPRPQDRSQLRQSLPRRSAYRPIKLFRRLDNEDARPRQRQTRTDFFEEGGRTQEHVSLEGRDVKGFCPVGRGKQGFAHEFTHLAT